MQLSDPFRYPGLMEAARQMLLDNGLVDAEDSRSLDEIASAAVRRAVVGLGGRHVLETEEFLMYLPETLFSHAVYGGCDSLMKIPREVDTVLDVLSNTL